MAKDVRAQRFISLLKLPNVEIPRTRGDRECLISKL